MRVEWIISIWFPACVSGRWLLVCPAAASLTWLTVSQSAYWARLKHAAKQCGQNWELGCLCASVLTRTPGPAQLRGGEERPSGEPTAREVPTQAWRPDILQLRLFPWSHTNTLYFTLHSKLSDWYFSDFRLKWNYFWVLAFPWMLVKGTKGSMTVNTTTHFHFVPLKENSHYHWLSLVSLLQKYFPDNNTKNTV